MDYQIVPNYKHIGCVHTGKLKQQRKGDNLTNQQRQNTSKKTSNPDTETTTDQNEVYFLQPMFKPPMSTKDISTTIGKREDDNIASYAVNAISDTNKDTDRNGQYNHFTMSRKGMIKANAISRVEDPYQPSTPHTNTENRYPAKNDNSVGSSDKSSHSASSSSSSSARRRASCVPDSPNKNKIQSRERMRRASAGDTLFKTNNNNSNPETRHPNRSAHSARHQTPIDQDCPRVVSIGPDEVLFIPNHRRPSEPANSAKRRESCGGKWLLTQGDNPPLPRRKSFHDWYSIQEWYLQEPRPASPDTELNSRRNVISPCTLSRLLPNTDDQGPKHGSNCISVCTEGDRMSYNFNLPSRRLVSHRELKNCSLPYSDNIGLEEAVSSDQARRVTTKSNKQSIAIKKKYETDRQTPKQVWYRTVRSILAANHLYHSVKRKNNNNMVSK